MISRRRLLGSTLAATGLLAARSVPGQSTAWPDHVVKIVVPFPAGGAADLLTRITAAQLQTKLGHPFIVENRLDQGLKSIPHG